jgi:serine protease Do
MISFRAVGLSFLLFSGVLNSCIGGEQYSALAESNSLCIPASSETSNECIKQKAKEITAKISLKGNEVKYSASASIIGKNKNKYFVLTNSHVVRGLQEVGSESQGIQIKTHDGQIYIAHIDKKIEFQKYDLALLWFESDKSYTIPTLSDSQQIKAGDSLFVSGFKCKENGACNEDYRFTSGQAFIDILKLEPLNAGYQIGYTNQIEKGMSGGPILDGSGKLIGINGRAKFPLNIFRSAKKEISDNNPFSFMQDDREVDPKLKSKLETLAWGVPLQPFLMEIKKMLDAPTVQPQITQPALTKPGIISKLASTDKQPTIPLAEKPSTEKKTDSFTSYIIFFISIYSLLILILVSTYLVNKKKQSSIYVIRFCQQKQKLTVSANEEKDYPLDETLTTKNIKYISYYLLPEVKSDFIKTKYIKVKLKKNRACNNNHFFLEEIQVKSLFGLKINCIKVDPTIATKNYSENVIRYSKDETIVLFFSHYSLNLNSDSEIFNDANDRSLADIGTPEVHSLPSDFSPQCSESLKVKS